MANYNLQGVSPVSFIAGGSITANRLVKADTTQGQVVVTTAITDAPLGVALETASSGGLVPVQMYGKAKLTAAAAISVGAQVMADSGGGGKIATASGATAVSCGIALEAAGADGDIIEVQLVTPNVKGPANS